MASFPYPDMQSIGSFSIDLSYNSNAFELIRVNWPVSMRSRSIVRTIQRGHVQLGSFHPEKSNVNLKDFKLIFSKLCQGKRFKIVIQRIQLDNWIDRDILISGVEERMKGKAKDSFSVYPNPFNTSTLIGRNLSKASTRIFFIFNTLGQVVFSRTIVSYNGH